MIHPKNGPVFVVIQHAGLLLDEPTTALDEVRRAAMVELLRSTTRERPLLVFATHDRMLAEVADYTLHLVNGRVSHFSARAHSTPST